MNQSESQHPKPPIARARLLAGVGRFPEHELAMARRFGLGIEIQTFAYPDVLSKEYGEALQVMRRELRAIHGPIGYHGPFIDTIHYSPDPEIMAVADMRYRQALGIAHQLGARFVVLHSQYNEQIKIPEYPDIYHNQSMQFWPSILEKAREFGLQIYLENMFEASAQALVRLANSLASPDLGLCLDAAHAALHSPRPISEWIEAFGAHLRHVHLSDCGSVYDDHTALGQGSLDIPATIRALAQSSSDLTYTLETGAGTGTSIEYLMGEGLLEQGGPTS